MLGIFVLWSVKDNKPRLYKENWLCVKSISDVLFFRGFVLRLRKIDGFDGSLVLNFTIFSLN
jgi:hypothetical protein